MYEVFLVVKLTTSRFLLCFAGYCLGVVCGHVPVCEGCSLLTCSDVSAGGVFAVLLNRGVVDDGGERGGVGFVLNEHSLV